MKRYVGKCVLQKHDYSQALFGYLCMFISLWLLKTTLTWPQLQKYISFLISPNKNSFQKLLNKFEKKWIFLLYGTVFYSRYLLVHITMLWTLYTFNNAWNTFLIFNFINVELYFYTILLPCLFCDSTYVFLVYFIIIVIMI